MDSASAPVPAGARALPREAQASCVIRSRGLSGDQARELFFAAVSLSQPENRILEQLYAAAGESVPTELESRAWPLQEPGAAGVSERCAALA